MNARKQRQGFWVAEYWVQPALSEIEKDGKVVQLEPKVMALLEHLASQPGEVFSRQDLEGSIWQGTIVGYDALSKAVTKLRDALGDDKKNPQYIQTISKKGYRLVATVQTENPLHGPRQYKTIDDRGIAKATTAKQSPVRKKLITGGILVGLIAGITIYGIFWLSGATDNIRHSTQPSILQSIPQLDLQPFNDEKPIVAVLPFRNISPDEGDAYLADGITSDLITDLSRLSGLWIVATKAVLAYKNIDISPEKARQEFDARYMLSGDVNKVGQAIRINVHLTDVEQGNILWANRYDRQFTDLFAIQDEVTQKIVQSLSLTLTHEEKQRIARRYTHNLQAYDYFLRGQALINVRTPEENSNGRALYKKAIDLDPGFARAYAGLAMTYTVGYVRQWPSDEGNPLEKAQQLSNRAIELDKDLPESYWVAGFVSGNQKNTDKAIELLRHALSLNPNYADAYAMLGWVYISVGEPEVALNHLAKALRLNPTGGHLYQLQLGRANYFMGNYEQALTYFSQAHQGNPTYIDTMLYMAATYVNLKRYDDVTWMLIEAKNGNPDLDPQRWIQNLPIVDENFKAKLLNDINQAESYME